MLARKYKYNNKNSLAKLIALLSKDSCAPHQALLAKIRTFFKNVHTKSTIHRVSIRRQHAP